MITENDMKPTELRIGNLVMCNGEVVKVEQITKKKIGYHRHKGETRMNYARLFEIPITEELLLKIGFILEHKEFYVMCRINGKDNSIRLTRYFNLWNAEIFAEGVLNEYTFIFLVGEQTNIPEEPRHVDYSVRH